MDALAIPRAVLAGYDWGGRAACVVAALWPEAQVIAWRRDLHQHPELGNREFRTAGMVADHLRALGLDEVRTGVAHTGVVGLLKGALPGPVVALRADMDGLPVTEEVDLPFASKAGRVERRAVGVMHACGHDCHVAILMGVAQVLAGPARAAARQREVHLPAGRGDAARRRGRRREDDGGRRRAGEAGAAGDLRAARHLAPAVGQVGYRPGPAMASADQLKITVHGRQTHGAAPWLGVDPIVTAAQVVLGLQTVVSRGIDITRSRRW
jgi:amidohydrolase